MSDKTMTIDEATIRRNLDRLTAFDSEGRDFEQRLPAEDDMRSHNEQKTRWAAGQVVSGLRSKASFLTSAAKRLAERRDQWAGELGAWREIVARLQQARDEWAAELATVGPRDWSKQRTLEDDIAAAELALKAITQAECDSCAEPWNVLDAPEQASCAECGSVDIWWPRDAETLGEARLSAAVQRVLYPGAQAYRQVVMPRPVAVSLYRLGEAEAELTAWAARVDELVTTGRRTLAEYEAAIGALQIEAA